MVVNLNYACVLYLICAEIVFASNKFVIQPPPKYMVNSTVTVGVDQSPTHHEAAPVTKPMPSSSTNASEVTTQTIHLNHNRMVTMTTVPSTTAATTTTAHPTSTPATLDETGKGNHSDHPSKEESKSKHTKSTSNTTTKVDASSTTITPPRTNSVSIPMEVKSVNTSTKAAGIAAFICVSIASTAFLSLFAWRYMYRKRHGNREILINEEDVEFNDEDLRHFELKLLNSEGKAIQS